MLPVDTMSDFCVFFCSDMAAAMACLGNVGYRVTDN